MIYLVKYKYFKLYFNNIAQKYKKTLSIGGEKVNLLVDHIGELLFDSEALSYVKYIEEILNVRKI